MNHLFVLLLLSLSCSSTFCLKLTANYDDFQNKGDRKTFDIERTLSLQCTADDETVAINWKKDDLPVDEAFKGLPEHYSVTTKGGTSTLEIKKSRSEDDGRYSCEAASESLTFSAMARAIAKVKPGDTAVVDGERLTLKCMAYGTDLQVRWIVPNTTDENRVIFTNLPITDKLIVPEGQLQIDHVKMSDRGTYQCIVQNGDDDDTAVISEAFVRIKDKYAALWPFIFICIEVFILCAIILIYEKKRNKTDVDDSETDIAPETKNGKK